MATASKKDAGADYCSASKEGTLTQGAFEVSGAHHNEREKAWLLEYAALVECASSLR